MFSGCILWVPIRPLDPSHSRLEDVRVNANDGGRAFLTHLLVVKITVNNSKESHILLCVAFRRPATYMYAEDVFVTSLVNCAYNIRRAAWGHLAVSVESRRYETPTGKFVNNSSVAAAAAVRTSSHSSGVARYP